MLDFSKPEDRIRCLKTKIPSKTIETLYILQNGFICINITTQQKTVSLNNEKINCALLSKQEIKECNYEIERTLSRLDNQRRQIEKNLR